MAWSCRAASNLRSRGPLQLLTTSMRILKPSSKETVSGISTFTLTPPSSSGIVDEALFWTPWDFVTRPLFPLRGKKEELLIVIKLGFLFSLDSLFPMFQVVLRI
eukprot:m.17732 g.17732  ORF g.17732 m.17732 type:complete len:104 (+) comp6094_c0_seq2:974-1285(+)